MQIEKLDDENKKLTDSLTALNEDFHDTKASKDAEINRLIESLRLSEVEKQKIVQIENDDIANKEEQIYHQTESIKTKTLEIERLKR